jgi:lipopolysaccharide transport system ATP-binding protein
MSNPIAIEFDNISKQYALGTIGTGTLSRDLNRWWARVRGKEDPYLRIGEANDRTQKSESGFVWALKDINFRVEQGDVLGIIGKNGAGKSTLLKILSRVTTPTTGTIRARGRIASLLEVGTGFHLEMTGRENIYMNGSIMGMTRAEIKRKLDEIVAFAGVERYIDTPVKRYSSGMTVRLGFAIAAHLEPEILVVDEVLAVGDAEFQRKAIGKMQDVASGEGRTVLFVSHNMAAVRSLCTRGLVLKNGTIDYMGDIKSSIDRYLEVGGDTDGTRIADHIQWHKQGLRIDRITIDGSEDASILIHSGKQCITVAIEGYSEQDWNTDMMLTIKSKEGYPLMTYALGHSEGKITKLPKGSFRLENCIEWPAKTNKGILKLDMYLHHPMVEWQMKAVDCCTIECDGYLKGIGNVMNMNEKGLLALEDYCTNL